MAKYTRTEYVARFPSNIQTGIRDAIRRKLRSYGMRASELDMHVRNAMNSRLSDLDELIDVDYWLDKANSTPGPKPKRK